MAINVILSLLSTTDAAGAVGVGVGATGGARSVLFICSINCSINSISDLLCEAMCPSKSERMGASTKASTSFTLGEGGMVAECAQGTCIRSPCSI
jgi:hypothetical protein